MRYPLPLLGDESWHISAYYHKVTAVSTRKFMSTINRGTIRREYTTFEISSISIPKQTIFMCLKRLNNLSPRTSDFWD
jgi:hypothetical protein